MKEELKRCRYCHSEKNLTRDHIIPISKGGKLGKKNIQTLCCYCNQMKRDMSDKQIANLFKWFKYILDNRKSPLNWDK